MRVVHITQDKLEQAWPHAAPWLEKAGLRGNARYPMEDLAAGIRGGTKLLFKCLAGDKFCWLVLGCVENSRTRTAVVYACGGRGVLEMLEDMTSFCEAYGYINHCGFVTCSGRAGWVRELARFAWTEQSRTCGKELRV